MPKNSKNVSIIVILIVLLAVRFFSREENVTWISFLNFLSVPIAIWGLITEFPQKAFVLRGVFFVIFLISVALSALVATQVIVICPKANDLLLILTLLITLPAKYYGYLATKKHRGGQ